MWSTWNFWMLRPFRPLKMSAAQGFARVRISQFHIVLTCFSCILPEQGLHLRYTESCPRGRRCDTRNFGRSWEFRPPDSPWYSSTQKISKSNIFCRLSCFLSNEFLSKFLERKPDENRHGELSEWSKVQHSKFRQKLWFSSPRKPLLILGFQNFKSNTFMFSLLLFSPKDFAS